MSGEGRPQRWAGHTVTVDVMDLHVLIAFAYATGRAEILTPDEVATLNRVVDACNAAKGGAA